MMHPMTAQAVPGFTQTRTRQIAPGRHTALLIALFLVLAVAGALFQRNPPPDGGSTARHPDVVPLYLSLIAAEWGLAWYVWRGIRRQGAIGLRELVGGRWRGARDLLRDTTLAIGAWAVWTTLMAAWTAWTACATATRWAGAATAADTINPLLPRGLVEVALWVVLSLSAGFCEELVFRGYLFRQFESLLGGRWSALALQAVLFGVSHGYQGGAACLKITLYGVLFGMLALWRDSLRPGMMGHAFTDIMAGLF
jgi:membrane protease YdiL (CAAX protease family)